MVIVVLEVVTYFLNFYRHIFVLQRCWQPYKSYLQSLTVSNKFQFYLLLM